MDGVERDLFVVSGFLARRDLAALDRSAVAEPFDVLVLAGCGVLRAPEVAAAAVRAGVADRIVVSGGLGHSTRFLVDALRAHPRYGAVATQGRSEAAMLADVLSDYLGIPAQLIAIEDRSTNCGENAVFTRRLLDRSPSVSSVLLVQDPTMQRRSHAAFERAWSDRPLARLASFAPFVPRISDGVVSAARGEPPAWPFERFVSLVLGEIRRLHDDEHGYGPRGRNFIDHVDVPPDVLAAFSRLVEHFPGSVRAGALPGQSSGRLP